MSKKYDLNIWSDEGHRQVDVYEVIVSRDGYETTEDTPLFSLIPDAGKVIQLDGRDLDSDDVWVALEEVSPWLQVLVNSDARLGA